MCPFDTRKDEFSLFTGTMPDRSRQIVVSVQHHNVRLIVTIAAALILMLFAGSAFAVTSPLTAEQQRQCAAGENSESTLPLAVQNLCDDVRSQAADAAEDAARDAGASAKDSAKNAGKNAFEKGVNELSEKADGFDFGGHMTNRTTALLIGLVWLYVNWRRTGLRKRLRGR